MSVDLASRAVGLAELMDDPGCDPGALDRTYRRFTLVNALVSGWRSAFHDLALPRLRAVAASGRTPRVLDLGCGGGDLARSIARWSRRDGCPVEVVGIDPDARAMRAARRVRVDGVSFRAASSGDLVAAGERFDLVVSNHVLHHLDAGALQAFLADSERLADLVLHSDIRRSAAAYRSYAAAVWTVSAGTFVRVDGLRSIRRSYTADELGTVLPPGWRAVPRSPHRLLAVFDATGAAAP